MKDLVSFVIPSFNCVTYLPAAVDSCIAQTYDNIEIIIVDDGSTDETKQYTKWIRAKDKRVVVCENVENMGRSYSRNFGNKTANGKYIYVLDADDMAYSKRVELTINKFNSAQFVHGGAEVIDCLGTRMGRLDTDIFNLKRTLEHKLLETRIVHSSVCYTKEFALKYPYPEGEICQLGLDDWAQQIQAAKDGVSFEYVPNIICHYRSLETSISRTRITPAVLEAKKKFLGLEAKVAA